MVREQISPHETARTQASLGQVCGGCGKTGVDGLRWGIPAVDLMQGPSSGGGLLHSRLPGCTDANGRSLIIARQRYRNVFVVPGPVPVPVAACQTRNRLQFEAVLQRV